MATAMALAGDPTSKPIALAGDRTSKPIDYVTSIIHDVLSKIDNEYLRSALD